MVAYDDLETALSKTKIKKYGSANGHNGIKSIMNHLGSDKFLRLKIGVSRPTSRDKAEVRKYVLEDFSESETSIL